MDIKLIIESLLFAAGEPLSLERLSKIIGEKEKIVKEVLEKLSEELKNQNRGIRLLNNKSTNRNEEWLMVTAPETTPFVQRLKKEVIEGDLSAASQETLAIIAYRGPITRAQINEIRGVDSSYILHQLLLRGLIERSVHAEKYNAYSDPPKFSSENLGGEKQGSRRRRGSYVYNISFSFLQHLGINNVQELPQYEEFKQKNR